MIASVSASAARSRSVNSVHVEAERAVVHLRGADLYQVSESRIDVLGRGSAEHHHRDLERIDSPAVLLTPAHHFPHGVPLHRSRRTAVVDWAERTGGYVLGDDYDGEFRYDRQPIGAVQGLAPDRVAYLGSARKSLSPVLRLGWMVLPDDLVDPVISAAGGQQFYVNGIIELTMADFISTGNYDRHIRCMRN